MTTPRTALEECLRLAELVTPPGEWKYSPWHVEEGPSAVLSTDGWAVCHTSSDTTAALIAAAINLLRTHGKALSEALGGWLPIDDFGTSAESVLLYNPALEKDEEFPGHPFMVSNRVYAKLRAKQNGYTHWKPITPPTSAKGSETNHE